MRRQRRKRVSDATQKKWYEENMKVKRGELVWSMFVNKDRFGARGGYVTPEEAQELIDKAAGRDLY